MLELMTGGHNHTAIRLQQAGNIVILGLQSAMALELAKNQPE